MASQRAIAKVLGLSQSTVSTALRGDPSIPAATRKLVEDAAKSLGYRPHPYVASLMSHIRSGRPLRDRGCIAIIADAADETEWFVREPYRGFYHGMKRRAEEIGFRSEVFYLKSRGMSAARLDRVLGARGIKGILLAPPKRKGVEPVFSWSRYACATISYTWKLPVDRAAIHHRHNMDRIFRELLRRGYRRPGLCIPPDAIDGVDSSWFAGFLVWQYRLPEKQRVNPYVGHIVGSVPASFRAWLKKEKPDALITPLGDELRWLRDLSIEVPGQMGLVCLNRPDDPFFSGMDERCDVLGAAAFDLVTARLLHNEFGIPADPKLVLYEGSWVQGQSIRAPSGEGGG